jgi:pyrroline-5-carboxylate reductase
VIAGPYADEGAPHGRALSAPGEERDVDERLAIIGSGRMGEALLSGLLRTGTLEVGQVVCTDVREERCREIERIHGVTAHGDNRAAIEDADVVLLAVKPQVLERVLSPVADSLRTDQIVVSIVAGITTAAIERLLPAGVPVVRVMPNTPALVDEGMAVVAGGRHADEQDVAVAEHLLAAVGEVVRLPENLLDAATAISGSGPAYLYLLAEAMIEAGVHLGLARETATTLVRQTLRGSATLLRDSAEHPALLREAVTSPGGTTAAALAVLEGARLRAAVIEAATAARERARELGGG